MSKFSKLSTLPPDEVKKKEIKKKTQKYIDRIRSLQHILYAEQKFSMLIVLQGMDASGKDGATKTVFSGSNPQGVGVTSFKVPTEKEKAHDFLWRVHMEVPEKGMIKIFNRSHYEDVLVTRVNGLIDSQEVKKRMKHINDFEKLLTESGTVVLKFYLHISEKEQAKRFHERLEDPNKQWKFNPSDITTAKQWPQYREAYQDVFDTCNDVPWTIVPSDENWYKEYIIAKTVSKALENMKLEFPSLHI